MIGGRLQAAAMLLPLLGMTQSQTAAHAAEWPREVRAIYDNIKQECRAEGGKFVADRAAFATQAEVTNDGKPDWIIAYAATRCTTSGYSAWCGTAGCTIGILGSGPAGLREIFNGNLRDWKVVAVDAKRKGLETSVHGSVCGGVGAEVCMQTLVWNGKKWAVAKQRRWTDADYAAAQNGGGDGGAPPPMHSARWQFGGSGVGAIAATTDHPDFVALGLRCQPGGGVYVTMMPKPGFALPAAGQALLVDFKGSANGDYDAVQPLVQEPGKPDLSGPLDPGVEQLLVGADTGLELIASTDGGGEWRDLDYMSLAGSTAAIRSLRQQCANAAGASADQQSAGKKVAPPLGIVPGYYVLESESCAAPSFEAVYYDGRRLGLMRGGGEPGSDDENFVGPLGAIKKSGKAYFLPEWEMEITILSPTRIQLTIQDTEAPRRWCSDDQIGAKWKLR